nr:uncharacterized protein LOC111503439 [Leptinotarsa decemlineata]
MTQNVYKALLKLFSTYKNAEYCTPVDFVEEQLKNGLNIDEDLFIQLVQHEAFLAEISEQFIFLNKPMECNRTNLIVLIYFIIFLLDETSFQNILHHSMHRWKNLLYFLSSEEQYGYITKTASSYFDNDHVLKNIIHPLLNKAQVLKLLAEYLEDQKRCKFPTRQLTQPVEFKFQLKVRNSPPPPSNTPMEPLGLPPRKAIPRTNYIPDLRVLQSIRKDHHRNLVRAKNLLAEAMKMGECLTRAKKYMKTPISKLPTIKARRVPATLKKVVETKGNLTTTLREAAFLMKEHETEIHSIEEIIKGGFSEQRIQELEIEDRIRSERRAIEDIQKKHLLGLLTFEEAILAKKKLVEVNKLRSMEVKATKQELADKLDKWRQEEQNKIKAQVERCQKSKVDAKEAETKLLEQKQTEVRLQQYETKELLKKVEMEKAKELARKVELIQEIKTLHEITTKMNESKKEFDPTESPNLGLMCEMSIAELNERLFITKMVMKQELEQKRKSILTKKEDQREMVNNVKNFIAQARKVPKPVSRPILMTTAEQSADLVELRKRLEEKRNLRIQT